MPRVRYLLRLRSVCVLALAGVVRAAEPYVLAGRPAPDLVARGLRARTSVSPNTAARWS